jgi:hypothetical protein
MLDCRAIITMQGYNQRSPGFHWKQTVFNVVEVQTNHNDKSDTGAHLVSNTASSHYKQQTCEDTLKTLQHSSKQTVINAV